MFNGWEKLPPTDFIYSSFRVSGYRHGRTAVRPYKPSVLH